MVHTIGQRLRNWYRGLGRPATRGACRRQRTVLRLEQLDERVLPDASPTLPHCFTTVLDTQHVDLNTNYVDGAWKLEANNIDAGTRTPMDDTLLYFPALTQGTQPTGSEWEFLGAGAGNPVWSIPQVRQPGRLALGFRSQETPTGTFASYFESDPRVSSTGRWETVTLKSVSGPGTFSLYQVNSLGAPQAVWMSASQGNAHDTDKIFVPEGGHFDYNWAFSQKGIYQVVVTVSGYLDNHDGTSTLSTSDDVTFNFAIVTPDIPPVHTTPGTVVTAFETPFTFRNANGISVQTAEDHPCGVQVTLSVDAGTLTLGRTDGLTFVAGTGANDGTVTFRGSVEDVNAALDGLVYTPGAGYSGNVNFTITTDDLGRYAPYLDSTMTAANHQSTTDSFTIIVLPEGPNQPPNNTVPVDQTVAAGGTLTFSDGNGNQITVYDVDAGSQEILVTLSVTSGTLTLSGTTGLTFVTGTGTNDATVSFTGTYADINVALQGLVFTAPSSADTVLFTITTDDQGHTGPGGPLSATDTFQIHVV
jgi:surface-anchored protein